VKVREDDERGFYVEATESMVRSEEQIMQVRA